MLEVPAGVQESVPCSLRNGPNKKILLCSMPEAGKITRPHNGESFATIGLPLAMLSIARKFLKIRQRNFIAAADVATSPTATLLTPEDYPLSFRDKKKPYAHKNDYQIDDAPITPTVFLYRGSYGTRCRLFFRTSIKLTSNPADHRFTAATFLLDTGCCPHLNLSVQLQNLLEGHIQKNDGREFYISTLVDDVLHNCVVKYDLPTQHTSINVMGLPMFFALGIAFRKGRIFALELDDEDTSHKVATFGQFKFL